MKNINRKGFIRMIIVIIIALIVLGALGFNVKDIMNSEKVQTNLHYAWDLVIMVWNNFLAVPALWIWDKIVIGLIWNNLFRIMSPGL